MTAAINEIREFIKSEAERFGAKGNTIHNKPFIERNNTSLDALQDNGAFFGLISPDEEVSGPYHDLSLVVFPAKDQKAWSIALGVGSQGFKNDYELAAYPGVRRLFSKLVNKDGFCKSDFTDIETSLPKDITNHEKLQHITNTIKKYTKLKLVCQILTNPTSTEDKKTISAFVAAYAKLRSWPSNNAQRKAISEALLPFMQEADTDDQAQVQSLLLERKYLVLQGPPGTGKTRLAKVITENLQAKSFFTQFHAETTYSDFIFGIRPDTQKDSLIYSGQEGPLVEAIKYAKIHDDEKVILIIDEINRANLANVLGPCFYLFEHKQDMANVEIEIAPSLKISELPKNLHVIATMNTADRSLAVVDFALRRRFSWYSLKPQIIQGPNFFLDDFNKIQEIFDWHASSAELSLQPGQGYFIATSQEEMTNRIRYEIFPLIREYLQEGLLRCATEEFNDYFTKRIGLSLSE
ncbi:MAG: AAA domain-containing protein [Pseudomonadota bacterium]|nr:AAA family ATPase [Pseudomonadota bacterium]QKK05085.1 MAG: AAA domain-containing protein [Pseudomonadota bacterium]